MSTLDPRYAGTASRDDPRFITKAAVKPNGYKRTKAQTRRENSSTDPYFRDPNDAPIDKGIV